MKPTIGIIGGSGPLATLDIEKKILSAIQKLIQPLTDQEYFNLVVFNYAGTYDRSDAVFFGRPDPLNQYIKYIKSISALEIDLILLACNTAHIYLSILKEKTAIPIISIIQKTIDYILLNFPNCSKVGLIGTTATQEKKLYHNLLSMHDVEVISAEPLTQNSIMEAIYLIKAGVGLTYEDRVIENPNFISNIDIEQDKALKNHPYKHILLQREVPNPKLIIEESIEELKSKGCQHVILGCTELPLVLPYLKEDSGIHLIDPNAIIAEAIVATLQNIENQAWSNLRVLGTKRGYI